jgi:hypothetical protein
MPEEPIVVLDELEELIEDELDIIEEELILDDPEDIIELIPSPPIDII